jgi:hypothetical protein
MDRSEYLVSSTTCDSRTQIKNIHRSMRRYCTVLTMLSARAGSRQGRPYHTYVCLARQELNKWIDREAATKLASYRAICCYRARIANLYLCSYFLLN